MNRRAVLVVWLAAILPVGCGGSTDPPREPPMIQRGATEFRAAFDDPVPEALRHGAPVRVAGATFGRVVSVRRGGAGAVVRLRVRRWPAAVGVWPVRADARLKIYPRLFRRGAYFLALDPGTRAVRALPQGGRIPATRTDAHKRLPRRLLSGRRAVSVVSLRSSTSTP